MKKFFYSFMFLLSATLLVQAQSDNESIKTLLSDYFRSYQPNSKIKQPVLDSIAIMQKQIKVYASESLSNQSFTPQTVDNIYAEIKELLPPSYRKLQLEVYSGTLLIDDLTPNALRAKKKDKNRLYTNLTSKEKPWVTKSTKPYDAPKGLQNKHIALWQSHGSYYKNDKNEWGWQRPNLFCTTEDLFTQSFVLPYIIPMLQNAGAYVFTPRERDIQTNMIVVDNDRTNGSLYIEEKSRKAKWQTTNRKGFAHTKATYTEGENPFEMGTARFTRTEKKSDKAFAEWVPTLPESGEYAVYVSYQTLPNSISDAKYLVFHKGGISEFVVNQKIGGGTWVYLGTFDFEKGNSPQGMVILTNQSKEKGVVCADAVRFGGGMSNIVRGASVSGLPRYLEGARYSGQWNGMPYDVYSPRKGENDYADDINVRSLTLNHLSGGSVFNPTQEGLKVPFELSMSFHTDAGYSAEDDIIGTLGIYTTNFNEGQLSAGTSRMASRDLTDLIMTEIQQDVPRSLNMPWTRRAMWDRNYSESRLPAPASTLIEILSHQNFADMRMGHDPNFKFVVSRAIYKGALKFLAEQYNSDYVVQPLPISHFAIEFGKKQNTLELTWLGEEDPFEPTASPEEFIVYMARGNNSFDDGVLVKSNAYTYTIEPGITYSFKIAAVNKGGESFPSETLSAYIAPNEKGKVLIVNGFNRLCGPGLINTPTQAGFDIYQDPGIAYHKNISLCGAQVEFDRSKGGKEGEGALGFSTSELEGKTVAGNTFDYTYTHGKAIEAAGNYSFVSASNEAVENGKVQLEKYQVVDLLLGLEKEDTNNLKYYKTFSSSMQRALTSYCSAGGNLLVSGAFVGTDMSHSQGNRDFTENILKYKSMGTLSDRDSGDINGLGMTINIPRNLNANSYAVTAPDCIAPVDNAFSVFAYSPTNESAAIAYKGNYRTFVLGFPFESIQSEAQRASIMASILNYFAE